MRQHRTKFLTCAALLLALCQSLPAPLVWRPGEGFVYEEGSGRTQGTVKDDSRSQLEYGDSLLMQEKYKEAMSAYAALVRRWPFSFFADDAQFKIGWCQEKLGDFDRAFRSYQVVIDRYPASEYFDRAIERQFAIANTFFAGEPQRIMRMPLLPSYERTIKKYQQIIRNAPHGRFAPAAQLRIGMCYQQMRRWSLAVDAFQRVIDRYFSSDEVDDAYYQIGATWFAAANQSGYDAGAAEKAVDAFREFLDLFPTSELAPQARENLGALKAQQSGGTLGIARFYESQKKWNAAAIYYEDIISRFPNSAEADVARERLRIIGPHLDRTQNGINTNNRQASR